MATYLLTYYVQTSFIIQYSLPNFNFRFHYCLLISILVWINLSINQFRKNKNSKLYKPVFHGNILQSLPWITGGHFHTYALPLITRANNFYILKIVIFHLTCNEYYNFVNNTGLHIDMSSYNIKAHLFDKLSTKVFFIYK